MRSCTTTISPARSAASWPSRLTWAKRTSSRKSRPPGGLDRWQPRLPLADDDFQRRLWLAIRAGRYGQPGRLPLVLGYGTGDRFAYGHRLLATTLPPNRVFKTFGFHDWATWHHLWKEILASPVSPLLRRLAGRASLDDRRIVQQETGPVARQARSRRRRSRSPCCRGNRAGR